MTHSDSAPGIDPWPAGGAHPADRLRKLNIIALGSIACLAIASQVVIQYAPAKQESDVLVINIAGRQRMLSRRLTKNVLALRHVVSDAVDHDRPGEHDHGHSFRPGHAYTDEAREVLALGTQDLGQRIREQDRAREATRIRRHMLLLGVNQSCC